MNYQVWIKDEYGEAWAKVDCGDLPAAKRELDKAVRSGRQPMLTQELPYELSIKVGEPGAEAPIHKVEKEKTQKTEKEATRSETLKSEAEPDKSPGPESEGEVRPGDLETVPELD